MPSPLQNTNVARMAKGCIYNRHDWSDEGICLKCGTRRCFAQCSLTGSRCHNKVVGFKVFGGRPLSPALQNYCYNHVYGYFHARKKDRLPPVAAMLFGVSQSDLMILHELRNSTYIVQGLLHSLQNIGLV